MRLIDADKLILHLNDYALQKSPSDVESAGDRKVSRAVYKAITDCIRAVDEQPTAFDLDKVMEQLEDRVSAEPERMVIYITWRKDGGFSCTANARNVGEN